MNKTITLQPGRNYRRVWGYASAVEGNINVIGDEDCAKELSAMFRDRGEARLACFYLVAFDDAGAAELKRSRKPRRRKQSKETDR